MIGLLLGCILILLVGVIYLYWKYSNEKKLKINLEQKKIPEKDLKFIEFTVDMYIKYSKDLDIHSAEQHDYIVKELERIREQYLQNEKLDI